MGGKILTFMPPMDGKIFREAIINRQYLNKNESSSNVTVQAMSNFFRSSLFKLAFLIKKKVKLENKN